MRFLESEIRKGKNREDECRFHIIQAPMELSVSYKNGTAKGPQAILEASDQLEAWDYSQSVAVIHESGIYTTLPVDCSSNDSKTILDNIEQSVFRSLSFNAIPVLLGGEHTVTLGALRALKKHLNKDNLSPIGINQADKFNNSDDINISNFGIIQLDAHADLRDTYHGDCFSHACVMRRAFDDLDIPLFQIGVRAISHEEVVFRKERNIKFIDAKALYTKGINFIAENNNELLPAQFPKKIYITLDVDGLDQSVIRATGTPVPGGISWYDTLILLEKIISTREVIGFDVVELAPIECDHSSDFAAAQLAYSVMGMIQNFRKN